VVGGFLGGSLGGDIKHDTEPGIIRDTSNAIHGTTDFLKYIAWIFHPHNILRAVEFLAGLGLMAVGLSTILKEVNGAGPIATVRDSVPGQIIKTAGDIEVVRTLTRRQKSGFSPPRKGVRSTAGPKDAAAYRRVSQKAAARKAAATRKANASRFGSEPPF
jgi:hypothetical protein